MDENHRQNTYQSIHLGRIPLKDTRPRVLDAVKPRVPESAMPTVPESAMTTVPNKQESTTKDMEKLRVALPENYLQPMEAKSLVQLSKQPGSPLTKHIKGKFTYLSTDSIHKSLFCV